MQAEVIAGTGCRRLQVCFNICSSHIPEQGGDETFWIRLLSIRIYSNAPVSALRERERGGVEGKMDFFLSRKKIKFSENDSMQEPEAEQGPEGWRREEGRGF